MSVLATYPASAIKNLSYRPPEHTSYAAGAISGQRLAIYHPAGNPSDYPVNASHPDSFAYMVFTQNNAFTGSPAPADLFSSSAVDINDTLVGSTKCVGIMRQCLQQGVAIVSGQVTSARTGQGVTGDGWAHAPGGILNYYESINRPSAKKDGIFLIQYAQALALGLQAGAAPARLCPNAWGVIASSGGFDTLAWSAFAPNREMELGSSFLHRIATVPHVVVGQDFCFTYADYHDFTGVAGQWPDDETGTGAGTSTAGNGLFAVLGRYRMAHSIINYVSDIGEDCIPPTWLWTDVASASANMSMPFPTGAETAAHALWEFFALKQLFPRRVYCATGAAGKVFGGVADYSVFLDRTDLTGPNPTAGVADGASQNPSPTSLTETMQEDGKQGRKLSAIQHILQNINTPTWDSTIPRRGIARRSQVNAIGRFICPARSDRAGVRITCTSTDGQEALLFSQSGYINQRRLGPGESVVLEGETGAVFAQAAGPSNATARYEIRELAAL